MASALEFLSRKENITQGASAAKAWNKVIRARGLPDYLCTTCIVREFVRVGQGFTATLWSEEFNGPTIEVVVNGQHGLDATLISEENTRLRAEVTRLTERCAVLQKE